MKNMALSAKWNYSKAMFNFIALIMMIMFCLVGTISTFVVVCWRHLAIANGLTNSVVGLGYVGYFCFSVCSLVCFSLVGFSIRFLVSFLVFLISFALLVGFHTQFAKTRKSVFAATVFIKPRNWFNFFTLRTPFSLYHNLALLEKFDLWYCNISQTALQGKNKRNLGEFP